MFKVNCKVIGLIFISINLQAMEYQQPEKMDIETKNIESLPDEILFQIFFEAITSGKLSDISTQYEILKKVNKKINNILEDKSRSKQVEELEILIKQVTDFLKEYKYIDFDIYSTNLIRRKNEALFKAVIKDYEELAKFLIDKGANINQKTNSIADTLLHLAAMNDATKVTELLINKGMSTNIKNSTNNLPLHLACFYKSLNTIKILVDNGSKINESNFDGDTPLHYEMHGETLKR